MAVYKRDIADINLETGNIHRTFLNHSIGLKDQQADHFGVRVFRNGEPVNLSGVSVQGVFMPPQGSPIAITSGNIVSGNVAEVVLPQACYNYDGQFCLAIKLVDATNSVTGTVRIVDGMVDNTHASGTVAPTSAVPTYQEVLAVYEQAIAAASTVNAMAGKMAVDITAAAESTSNNSFKDLGNRWMTFRRGYYSTPAVGSTSSYTDDVNYVYALVACIPGDVLHAHSYGGSTSIGAWAFLDSSLNVITRGGSGEFHGTQTAPADSAFVLVNVKLASLGSGYYGWTGPEAIRDQIANLKSALNDVKNYKEINIGQTWEQNGIATGGGNSNSAYRIRTWYYYVNDITTLHAKVATGYTAKTFFYPATGSTKISDTGTYTGEKTFSVPATAVRFRTALYKGDGSSIDANLIYPADGSNFEISYPYPLKTTIQQIDDSVTSIIKDIGTRPQIEPASLRQGTLNSKTGAYDSSNMKRVSSSYALPVDLNSQIYISPDFTAAIYWYADAGWSNYIGPGAIYAGLTEFVDLTIPSTAKYYRLLLQWAATPNNNLSPSDVDPEDCYIRVRYACVTKEDQLIQTAHPRMLLAAKDAVTTPAVPPDSCYAIKETAKAGYDMVRFSLFVTTDNKFVCVHDIIINNLAVNPDGTEISTRIETASCSLAELNQYDWGLRYGQQYAGLTVPTLEDCLKYASLYNLSVSLDIKNVSDFTTEVISSLSNTLLNYGHDNAIIIRANSTQQAQLNALCPRYSFEHISDLASLNANMSRLKAMMTGVNHIYWANTGESTQEAKNTAYANGIELSGSAETIAELASSVIYGARYIECENIGMVKYQLRNYTDSLIESGS